MQRNDNATTSQQFRDRVRAQIEKSFEAQPNMGGISVPVPKDMLTTATAMASRTFSDAADSFSETAKTMVINPSELRALKKYPKPAVN